jgi:hypothetical protein
MTRYGHPTGERGWSKETTLQRARQAGNGSCPFTELLLTRPDAASWACLKANGGKRSRMSLPRLR